MCLVALAAWAGMGARGRRPSPVARLTTARAILDLSPEAAERQVPVLLADAIVTSFDPAYRLWFVQDHTAGLYLDTLAAQQKLQWATASGSRARRGS